MKTKISAYAFSKIYPLYLEKIEKKGRTKAELDQVLCWLTGYDEKGLQAQTGSDNDLELFFAQAPQINPDADKITGVICGVRVEEIQDPLTQQIRRMDKLVDELAKGKAMDKILRRNL